MIFHLVVFSNKPWSITASSSFYQYLNLKMWVLKNEFLYNILLIVEHKIPSPLRVALSHQYLNKFH